MQALEPFILLQFRKKAWVEPISIVNSDGPASPGLSSTQRIIYSDTDKPKPKKKRMESTLKSFIIELKENKPKEREDREQQRAKKKSGKKLVETEKKENQKCTKTKCSSTSLCLKYSLKLQNVSNLRDYSITLNNVIIHILLLLHNIKNLSSNT